MGKEFPIFLCVSGDKKQQETGDVSFLSKKNPIGNFFWKNFSSIISMVFVKKRKFFYWSDELGTALAYRIGIPNGWSGQRRPPSPSTKILSLYIYSGERAMLSKSEFFKQAHINAKQYREYFDCYKFAFSFALTELYAQEKALLKQENEKMEEKKKNPITDDMLVSLETLSDFYGISDENKIFKVEWGDGTETVASGEEEKAIISELAQEIKTFLTLYCTKVERVDRGESLMYFETYFSEDQYPGRSFRARLHTMVKILIEAGVGVYLDGKTLRVPFRCCFALKENLKNTKNGFSVYGLPRCDTVEALTTRGFKTWSCFNKGKKIRRFYINAKKEDIQKAFCIELSDDELSDLRHEKVFYDIEKGEWFMPSFLREKLCA